MEWKGEYTRTTEVIGTPVEITFSYEVDEAGGVTAHLRTVSGNASRAWSQGGLKKLIAAAQAEAEAIQAEHIAAG